MFVYSKPYCNIKSATSVQLSKPEFSSSGTNKLHPTETKRLKCGGNSHDREIYHGTPFWRIEDINVLSRRIVSNSSLNILRQTFATKQQPTS